MNRPAILTLTATASALSLGLLAINFGSVAPEAAAQAPARPRPDLHASPKAADVVDAADAFLATLTEEQRATAQIELTPQLAVRWTNFPGGSERAQRRLLPRPQARAGRGGPESRPGRPGRGGFRTIPGSPRGRRRLRQGAGRPRARRPGRADQKKADGDPDQKKAGGAAKKKGGGRAAA